MKIAALDPAEEWLAKSWLGNLYPLLGREEIATKIKERLFTYINNLLEKTKQYKPSYNPDKLFEDRKILKKIEAQLPRNRSGMLIPIIGGFFMKIRSDEHEYRKRFSTAHEIGHTFFYDLKQSIPTIRFLKSNSRYWVEEDYANEIAAAILLPEASLRKVIIGGNLAPSLDALENLCNLYKVSHEVLWRRIVRNQKLWDCIIFKSMMGINGTINTDSVSVSKGISFKKWIIPKVIKENLYSIIAPVFKERQFSGELDFKGSKYTVESKLIRNSNSSSCITLIKKDN